MNWEEHVGIAVVLCCFFAILLNTLFGWYAILSLNIGYFVLVILVSSLAPDLDHQSGKLGIILRGLSWIVCDVAVLLMLFMPEYLIWKLLIIYGVAFGSFIYFIGHKLTHRGIVHSIPICIVYGLIIFYFLGLQLSVLGMVAYYSHLVADGIPFKIK